MSSSNPKQSVTVVDVAQKAGVSISAVSRAFNPQGNCSKKMRAKVFAAADELGYVPNRLARGIKSRSNLIGILMSDFENPAYLSLLNHFTHKIQANHSHTLLINTGSELEAEQAVDLMVGYRIDGLIVTSAHLPEVIVEGCKKNNIPLVFFGRPLTDQKAAAVYCDNIYSGQMAADLLIEAGYKAPAFVGGPLAATSTIDRQRGFIGKLIELGCEQWFTAEGGAYSYDAGYEATLKLFASGNQPDALFYADDIMACGGMDALRYELLLDVPEQVGVIGVDNIRLSRSKAYNLTTINQPFELMVEQLVNLLNGLIQDEVEPQQHIKLPCELIVRKSTR